MINNVKHDIKNDNLIKYLVSEKSFTDWAIPGKLWWHINENNVFENIYVKFSMLKYPPSDGIGYFVP